MNKLLIRCFVYQCLTLAFLSGFPTEDKYEDALSRHEEIHIEGRAYSPDTQLKMEHRELNNKGPIKNIMEKVLNSKTVSVVDKAASNVVKLAGGVVEDLGDFVVDTIDQLPRTIELLSDAVGKAVDDKREKVLIMVKAVKPGDKSVFHDKATTTKLASAVENSEFHSSLQRLEDAFASLIGKVIGVTYKNAENISSAFNNGIKRITGTQSDKKNIEELSRSFKEPNEISEKDSNTKGGNDNNINTNTDKEEIGRI